VLCRAMYKQVTLIWPGDVQMVTIGDKWRRLPTGEVEATYTREELALCLALMDRIAARRKGGKEAEGEP